MVAGYIISLPILISNIAIVAIMIWIIRHLYYNEQTDFLMSNILRGLEMLGRNTLEIYFLHYFILFSVPFEVGKYLTMLSASNHSLSAPEFIIIGTVVIIICFMCIVMARLLKTIPYIYLLTFGKPTSI